MKARDVVGKRIAKVNQTQRYDHSIRELVWETDSIWLEDGTRIVLFAAEDEYDHYVIATAFKP